MPRFTLRGQDAAVRILERALDHDRLHHAYLFAGPAHVGKTTLAVQLAQAVNCDDAYDACRARIANGSFADVRFIAAGEREDGAARTLIGIEAVRDIIAAAHLRPYEGKRRVFIIEDAARMSTDAANALLKVLEEPPPDVLIVLLTEHADDLLATIRSRCQTLELRPMSVGEVARILQEEHGQDAEQADLLARLSRGCLGWALQAAAEPAVLAQAHQRIERIVDAAEAGLEGRFAYADDLARRFFRDRAEGREELYAWLRWLRDVLLTQQGRGAEIVNAAWRSTIERHAAALPPAATLRWARRVEEAIDALDRNANPRLTLEAMLLEAPPVPAPTPAP
ncbi:MAG: DNA polymerase III subunit [Chloroflexota bacterium]|nr:DNA polymerase III subunit [Chloroflexota bacterium]